YVISERGGRTLSYLKWSTHHSYQNSSDPATRTTLIAIAKNPAKQSPMYACLLRGPNKLEMADLPVPQIKPGEVLVNFHAGGICGTDLEKIQGGYGPGGILGHEVSGVVGAVGNEVKGVKLGDRVVPHHHVPCFNCRLCELGDFTMCHFFRATN